MIPRILFWQKQKSILGIRALNGIIRFLSDRRSILPALCSSGIAQYKASPHPVGILSASDESPIASQLYYVYLEEPYYDVEDVLLSLSQKNAQRMCLLKAGLLKRITKRMLAQNWTCVAVSKQRTKEHPFTKLRERVFFM